MRHLHIAIVLCLLLLVENCLASINLIQNKKANSVIVLPQNCSIPGESDVFNLLPNRTINNESAVYQAAGLELRNYIEQASGIKIPITTEDKLDSSQSELSKIYIGLCKKTQGVIDVSKIQPEGFVIKSKDNDLFIAGKDITDSKIVVAGTLYGVYEFLERYVGVRWLLPTKLGEVVPHTDSIIIESVDIKQEPLLWQRNLRNSKIRGHRDRTPQIIAGWGIAAEEWEKTFADTITGPWFIRNRLGARVKADYGHAYTDWWKKYGVTKPEIFAMQPNGSRTNTTYREQFCTSNPELWDLIAQAKIAEFSAKPQLSVASISLNDDGADNKFCCCEKCAADDPPGSPKIYGDGNFKKPQISLTDRHFRFYNEIAQRVAKVLPDKYLGVYAYEPYIQAPVKLDHLEKNLVVGFVGWDTYLNDNYLKKDRELWLKWGKLANQLFLRPNLFWRTFGLPINYSHKFAADIRMMAQTGMRAADFDGLIGNWGAEGMQYYITAKLLWNPYADVNSIIDDYCKAAYGKGSDAMKAYYNQAEQLTNKIAADGHYTDFKLNTEKLYSYFTDDVIKSLRANLTKAIAQIGDSSPAAVERVKLIDQSLDYTYQTRQVILAAFDFKNGKIPAKSFEESKKQFIEYSKKCALSWAISSEHNYSYLRYYFEINVDKQGITP